MLGAEPAAGGLLLVASRGEARPPLLDELLLIVLVGEPEAEVFGRTLGLIESPLAPHSRAPVVGRERRVVADLEAQQLRQLAVGFGARGHLGHIRHAGRALPQSPLLRRELHKLDGRLAPFGFRLAFGAGVRGDGRELVLPLVRVPELFELAREEVGSPRSEGFRGRLAWWGRCQQPPRHREEQDPALFEHEVGAVSVRERTHILGEDGQDHGRVS